MSVDPGRKVQVQVMFTERLLEQVDEIAKEEAAPGDEPNRSKTIRRLVSKGIERERGARMSEEGKA